MTDVNHSGGDLTKASRLSLKLALDVARRAGDTVRLVAITSEIERRSRSESLSETPKSEPSDLSQYEDTEQLEPLGPASEDLVVLSERWVRALSFVTAYIIALFLCGALTGQPSQPSPANYFGIIYWFPAGLALLIPGINPPWTLLVPYCLYAGLALWGTLVRSLVAYYKLLATFIFLLTANVASCTLTISMTRI